MKKREGKGHELPTCLIKTYNIIERLSLTNDLSILLHDKGVENLASESVVPPIQILKSFLFMVQWCYWPDDHLSILSVAHLCKKMRQFSWSQTFVGWHESAAGLWSSSRLHNHADDWGIWVTFDIVSADLHKYITTCYYSSTASISNFSMGKFWLSTHMYNVM